MATNSGPPQGTTSLKKQLGLVSTTSYITGAVIGVGIFISPSSILRGSGSSMGVAILVWGFCGAITYCAAMCYAELGTRVHKSGGTYTYIREAFGDLAGFVFLWVQLVLVRPLSITLGCLSASEYIMRPLFLHCPDLTPVQAKTLLGFAILGVFTASNMYSVKLAARVQTLSTVTKLFAICSIIVAGFVHICQGNTENFSHPFATKNLTPGGIALAVYAGLYAYAGWDNVNVATEEVINPRRTIPLAILGGLSFPTVLYILINIAYHAVLTNDEILSGVAVAVVFGEKTLGSFRWIILPCIAISAAGIVNAVIFTASRINYVGGRDGLFPRFLGMVNVKRHTPQPSIAVLFFIAAMIISTGGELKSVLGAYAFFKAGGEFLGVLSIFRIRKKHPATKDTYIVHWIFPVLYIIFFLVLAITAIINNPRNYLIPSVITLLGVPFYFVTKTEAWRTGHASRLNDFITMVCQRLLLCQHSMQETEKGPAPSTLDSTTGMHTS